VLNIERRAGLGIAAREAATFDRQTMSAVVGTRASNQKRRSSSTGDVANRRQTP